MPEETQPGANEPIVLTKGQLNDIVAAQMKQMLSEMMASPSKAAEDPQEFIKSLAMTMAEIADQGTSRKRVAPEILARRAQAQVRLVEKLKAARERIREAGLLGDPEEAQRRGMVPEYRLRSEQYLDNQLIPPFYTGSDKRAMPTEIYWAGAPNDGMVPINDLAYEIFAEFAASVGNNEAVPGASADPYWVSAGGVVIKGRAPSRRTVGMLDSAIPADYDKAVSQSMLGVRGRDPINPNAPEVAILGTIQAPAKQSQLGTF